MTKSEVERLAVVETKVGTIELQVTNHIPSSLRELDGKIDKINLRLAYASGAVAVVIILAQLAISRWIG